MPVHYRGQGSRTDPAGLAEAGVTQPPTPSPCHISKEPRESTGGAQAVGRGGAVDPALQPESPAPSQITAAGPLGISLPLSAHQWYGGVEGLPSCLPPPPFHDRNCAIR